MTAVEWIYEEIWKQFGFSCSSNILEKAKEMEKQQVIDFADSYGTYLLVGGTMSAATYNETFKNTNK
jgi:hypothetical protein